MRTMTRQQGATIEPLTRTHTVPSRRLWIMATAILTMFTFAIPHALAAPTVANDDSATTNENTAVTVVVFANDTDADGDTLFISAVTQPTNGTIQVNPGYTVTYTPNVNYQGTDSFTYNVWDGTSVSNFATVTITIGTINDAPAAVSDTVATNEDSAVAIDVLANDTDAEGDALTVVGTTNPTDGTVTVNMDNTITYTPNANYHGTDSFTYTVSDGTNSSNAATVTITITAVVDDPPPAAPSPAPDLSFDDLEGFSNEVVAAIETLVDLGIITGTDDTSFSPELITERWEMAMFLTRVLAATSIPLPTAEPDFSDLSGYSVEAQTAMQQLAGLGISTGTSADEFSPGGQASRAQMALFLVRTLEAGGVALPTPGDGAFTDLEGYPVDVQNAVDVLSTLGITNGTTGTTFSPAAELPRWQMALFLTRVIEVIQAN